MRIIGAIVFALGIAALAASQTSCDDDQGCALTCCKHCKNSQPCGDSCIPYGQSCSKSGGCACSGDADEDP
jgi:hypothetical protein